MIKKICINVLLVLLYFLVIFPYNIFVYIKEKINKETLNHFGDHG